MIKIIDSAGTAIRFVALLITAGLCAPALAQQVPHPAPMSLPKTNVELKAINGGINLRAARLGFTTPGDGGYAEYNWSASNCTAADDGAQVQPNTGSGCWIADFSSNRPTPMVWGAKGDGTANDSPAVQAAVTARQGDTLWLGERTYKLNTGVTSPGRINIVGEGGGQGIYNPVCTLGLRYGAANIDLVTLAGPDSKIERVCIDNGSVTNTAGRAIFLTQGSERSIASDNTVYGACTGIEMSASSTGQLIAPTMRYNTIVPAANNLCRGARIGGSSFNGLTTDAHYLFNQVYCGPDDLTQVTKAVGLEINDSGGLIYNGTPPFGCSIGTKILIGAGQNVIWSYFTGGLGDSSGANDLLMDTTGTTAVMFGNNFVGTWTASARNGANVKIASTGASGNISGQRFYAHRTYQVSNNPGFEVLAGVDFKLDNSVVCVNSDIAAPGVLLGGTTTRSHITDNVFGKCDQTAGTQQVGVRIAAMTGVDLGTITGNDFSFTTTPIDLAIPAQATLNAVIENNRGVDNLAPPLVPSATNLTLPMRKVIPVSGTTAVVHMSPGWSGRAVVLVALDPAGLTFTTAGDTSDFRMCNSVTVPQNGSVFAWFDAGSKCWLLK